LHRQELKHDKFVEQVGHTVEYAASHKDQIKKWGGIAAAVLVVIAGIWLYMDRQSSAREQALREAMKIQEANVGEGTAEYLLSFKTQAEKDAAAQKAFGEITSKYGNTREGLIAKYFLGTIAADQGKAVEAEQNFKYVAENATAPYASQAKFSLAQLYASQGKTADAEKLLRSIMANPTILVSKEQATISLARVLATSNPAEARKLVEPLRTDRSTVSRAAITVLSEIPAQAPPPMPPAQQQAPAPK
jgi:TolA-binding protein